MKRASCGAFAVALPVAAVVAFLLMSAVAGRARAQGDVTLTPKPRVANPATFAPASAASVKPTSPQQRDERRFLKDAAARSRFESEAARLALGKSGNAGVRALAGALANHHRAAGSELQYMLHVRDMAAPMLGNDQRKTLNRLAKLQGGKFDRQFMEELGVKSQQENVQAFERASLGTRDPQIKAWIDKTLPTLRTHVQVAERHASQPALAQSGLATSRPEAIVTRASLSTRSMAPNASTQGATKASVVRKPSGSRNQ